MALPTVVYTSEKKTHFFKEIKEIFKDIRSSNFLAYQTAKRDIQAQYRQSLLGILWAFIPVIINSVVWIFLNSSGAVKVNAPSGIPYSLYVVIGTTLWSIFVDALQSPIDSINMGKSIISKINFPKEALIISGVYKNIFTLGMKLLVLAFFLIIFGVVPNTSLLYFPFYLIAITIFALAIGVFLAPVGLLYSDVGKIILISTQFLMYITPVVYMIPQAGRLKLLFEINPLTYLITDMRNALTGVSINHFGLSVGLVAISLLVLLVGLVILRKSMTIIIEKIS